MSAMRLLEGDVGDPRDTLIAALREEVAELQNEVHVVRDALQAARQELRDASQPLTRVRHQLTPLYNALCSVFGDLDAAGVESAAPTTATASNPRTSAVWESWKARLPGGPAKIIDALLVHTEMNTQQLSIATGVHRNSIPTMIYKLNRAGLINKNGGRFSLKAL